MYFCYFDFIIIQFELPLTMPPKNKQKNESKRMQANRIDVVAIEQELSRQENDNSVPEILRKLEVTYKEHKESLNQSLLQMILRICGLSEIVPRLAQSSSMESIASYVQEIGQKKITMNSLPILINSKDQFHKQFLQRLSLFFSKLISNDFPYMKEQNQTKFLENMRNSLIILSKSLLRNVRYAAVELIRIFIQSELSQYSLLIREKQSRKAFEFCKDVQNYFKSNIKLRLKDIDSKIRQSIQTIIKKAFITMETDLVNQSMIQDLFLTVLQDSNAKLLQNSLASISSFISQSKKLKAVAIDFVLKNLSIFQKASIIPNRNGNHSLRILVRIQKQYPQRSILNPGLISRIFEFYSIEKYSVGLNTAIQAFYHSIYSDQEQLLLNKSSVLIELVNLINNYQSRAIKETIINSFFQYYKVPCQKIFSFDQIISIILSQQYSFQNSQINISDKQIQGWFEIAYLYAKYVKRNIQKYEALQSQKYREEQAKWKTIAQAYNNNILMNIREIYHKIINKRASWFVKYYLQLIGQLFLPIASNYQKYLEYLLQKMINLFQTETNSVILKEIVEIFFNLKSFNFQGLTSHFDKPHNFTPQVILIKKFCILSKFYVHQYVNSQFLQEILRSYKKTNVPFMKIDYLVGLYVIHQWYVNSLLENPLQNSSMEYYKNLQAEIIRFLFALLTIQQVQEVKFAAFNILCNLMSIVCNDQIQDIPQMYYSVSEQQMNFIYKFLDKQIGLPRLEDFQSQDKSTLQMTRIMNSLGNFSVDKQKSIKKLFELLNSSFRVSSLPQSIEIILATLIKENTTIDMDQSISRINKTFDFGNMDINNIFARERLATKYFQHLIDQEIFAENVSKFVYWKIFTVILKFKTSTELKQKLITRLLDIYLKKKFTKQQTKLSLNKALLFVISELDRIHQQSQFKDLHFIHLLLKKFIKRIANEVLQRVLAFYRTKYQNQITQQDDAEELLKFLEKQCKSLKNQPDEDNQEDEKQIQSQENIEQNEREMMKPARRQTRSSTKRQLRA